jgi:uncharacterized protein HemX
MSGFKNQNRDLAHELHVITLLFLFLATSILIAIILFEVVPNAAGHMVYILAIAILAGAAMYFFWLTRVSFKALSGEIVSEQKLATELNARLEAQVWTESMRDLEKHKIEATNLVRELELAVSAETESLKVMQEELDQARARLDYAENEIRKIHESHTMPGTPPVKVQ